eukprot:3352571-Amphidinium_carterae.1
MSAKQPDLSIEASKKLFQPRWVRQVTHLEKLEKRSTNEFDLAVTLPHTHIVQTCRGVTLKKRGLTLASTQTQAQSEHMK